MAWPLKQENSQQAIHFSYFYQISRLSLSLSLSRLQVLRVGMRKTKHMFIVSLGVYGMSCSLSLLTVAANSQLCFSRLSVSPHLVSEDTQIPMHWKKAWWRRGGQISQPFFFLFSRRALHTALFICFHLITFVLFSGNFQNACSSLTGNGTASWNVLI